MVIPGAHLWSEKEKNNLLKAFVYINSIVNTEFFNFASHVRIGLS